MFIMELGTRHMKEGIRIAWDLFKMKEKTTNANFAASFNHNLELMGV
jgi:hypothetical protein